MNPAIIGALVKKALDEILDRIPDPNERAKAREELERIQVQGQLQANTAEAGHRSIFVAGWRPFIGWVGGSALAWHWLLKPIATFALLTAGVSTPLPELVGIENVLELIAILLGVGGMRTFEKLKGVAK